MKIIKWASILYIYLSFNITAINYSYSKELNIPNQIVIELNNSEYNKYLRRSMKAYTDGELYGKKNIKKKYKKWAKAKILINKKKIDSEIRILGDWKDHLRPPETSLKVKINDDSFYGITRFNLFLPETRKGENEVFWTLLLKEIGFPALYTRMIDVNLNGNIYRAILQEDAAKEYLERNNLTETVILKSNDFDFYLNKEEREIYDKYFTSAFVIDNNNFLKNDISNFIASEAIALKLSTNFNQRVINESFYKNIHKKYANHALDTINRKYIYLPYKKSFLPLYYDGNVQFLPGKTNCKNKVDKKKIENFELKFKELTKKNLSKIQICVFKDIYNLSKKNLIKSDNFFLQSNFSKKESPEYKNIKNQIENYINKNNIKKISTKNQFQFKEKMITYTLIYNDKYFSCFLNIKNNKIKYCNEIDNFTYSKFISESGRSINTNDFKSFPINLGTFNNEIPLIFLDTSLNEFSLNKKATYIFTEKIYKKKNLKFVFKNDESKLFIQGNFFDVNFEFENEINNYQTAADEIRYDKNLLTGCINFFNSYLENISIKSSQMKCEDSVNIKKSYGNINNIEINNSSYDALDIDFSKLSIKDIIIKNAQNDCIDLSFGDYKIKKLFLTKCGDKGISAGESSTLNLDDGIITYSDIGVASKDDAEVNMRKINLKNINICLSAYNKKKEFQGAEINVNELNCSKFKIKTQSDTFSKINISNEY